MYKRLINKLLIFGFGLLIVVSVCPIALSSGPGGGEDPNAPELNTNQPDRNQNVCDTTDDILVITYDNNGDFAPNSLNIYNTLVDLEYNVTHLHNPASGVISSTLSSEIFDQIWLFDVDITLRVSASDAAAIATWYNDNVKGNIIIDARSYGAYYEIATDMYWIENEAYAFSTRCGGLWIGVDNSPSWTYNGNAVLSAIGYATATGVDYPTNVAGDYSTATATELLTVPNVLIPSNLHAFATPGHAPIGVQFDGTVLVKVLAVNSASGAPLASASLTTSGQCLDVGSIIVPDTIHKCQENALNPLMDTIYLFDFPMGYTAYDVNQATILVNYSITPLSSSVIADDTLMIITYMSDFIGYYGLLWDTSSQIYNVDGLFNDDACFASINEVIMIGHRSGDLNLDREVNVADINYLMDYLFFGGPAPAIIEMADVDGSGSINVADLTYFIDFLFRGGPPPANN